MREKTAGRSGGRLDHINKRARTKKQRAFLLQSHKRALLIGDVTGCESKHFLSAKIKRFCINFHDGVAQLKFPVCRCVCARGIGEQT